MAASSEQPAATVEALPPEIATVRTAGWWTEAHRAGTYRIVITEHGFDKIVSRLYLQWLEPDAEAGPRILATVGFEQLNEVPVYHLEIAAIRPLQDGLEVELDGSSLYTGETRRFLLHAAAPGTATLRPKP